MSSSSAAQNTLEPVILVLETESPSVNAAVVRSALGDLGVPAVSLLDPRAANAIGTLTVAVARDGKSAQAHYSPRSGDTAVRFLRAGRRADARGRWMVPALAALVRAMRAPDPLRISTGPATEVLDPWSSSAGSDPSLVTVDRVPLVEVIDPWMRDSRELVAQVHPRDFRVTTEVLDPWGDGEPMRRTDAQIRSVDPEIVDPWVAPPNERAGGLSRPRPGVQRTRQR